MATHKRPEKRSEMNFAFRLDLDATYLLHKRVEEIRFGGDPADCPKRLPRPGDGYAAGDRLMITCPVCGRKKLIAPRMHPYWLRDRAGRVRFVCGETCTAESAPYAPIQWTKQL